MYEYSCHMTSPSVLKLCKIIWRISDEMLWNSIATGLFHLMLAHAFEADGP